MQPRPPRRPTVRAVRRELEKPRPAWRPRRAGARLRALLLLALLTAGGWFLWQRVGAPAPPPVVAVRHGAVEAVLEADAWLVRKERVVTAPVAGQVRRLAAEGERARVGGAVVEIGPESARPPATAGAAPPPADAGRAATQREYDRLSTEIYRLAAAVNEARFAGQAEQAAALQAELDDLALRQAALVGQLPAPSPEEQPSRPSPSPAATRVTTEVAGVVLYQTDGLESILTPAGAERWTPSWVRALPLPDLKQTGREQVAAGQPLFKVVDDLHLELILVVPAERLTPSQRTIMAEDGVKVRIPGRERPLTAHLRRIAEEGEELLLHLEVPLPAAEALRVRRMRVSLLLESFEGAVVPRAAIDVQGGRTGVWVREGRAYQFTPVRVLGGNRTEVAVEGDLAPDAQVLTLLPPPTR
ncbi:MAG: HlyD family efflux transporter periplasmic adaptor subunit [Bacillota bacterium]